MSSKRKLSFNDNEPEDYEDVAGVIDIDSSSSSGEEDKKNESSELSFCMTPCAQPQGMWSKNSSISDDSLLDDKHDSEQVYAYKKAKLETLTNMACWMQQMAESLHTIAIHSKQMTTQLDGIVNVAKDFQENL